MKKKIAAALSGLLLISICLLAHRAAVLCDGFLPENDMRIPFDGLNAQSGLNEAAFNRVLDRVQEIYGPIVASKGGKLAINRLWRDAKVNASATQMFGTWTINMYGGLARHPAITEEGFALVACHELGHHIGGSPKLTKGLARVGLGRWATNEGGADYFATLKCMRLVAPSVKSEIDAAAAKACDAAYADPQGRAACRAGALAGQSVAGMFQSFRNGPPVSFTTPNPSIVRVMFDRHPQPQCRLATYFQGALCPKSVAENVSDRDPDAGTCTRRQGFLIGLRPRCWYKPPAGEPIGPTVASVLQPADVDRVMARLETLKTAFETR